MSEYNIKGGVHCAEFFGGDQKNITYGFDAEDVERLIENVMELMQAGGIFLPHRMSPMYSKSSISRKHCAFNRAQRGGLPAARAMNDPTGFR
jgi:hypothetical protein